MHKHRNVPDTLDAGRQSETDHPAHYNAGRIEVIDFIEDQQLGFNLGNVVKYATRAAHKGAALDDLTKAVWYLNREIQHRRWPQLTSKQAQARERAERGRKA